jgi:hypothetical protein
MLTTEFLIFKTHSMKTVSKKFRTKFQLFFRFKNSSDCDGNRNYSLAAHGARA